MAGNEACEFIVAVTGHTRLNDEARIRALADQALREIKSAADEAMSANGRALAASGSNVAQTMTTVQMVVSTCLAAGADQLVAEAALAAGYRVRAILPGNPDEYRKMIRFADDPQREASGRSAYDRLLHAAGGDVTNLAMPLPEGPANEAARHHAYDAATNHMLERCDLLIAIVDVLHRKDLGMTGDAVRFALRAKRPILWIDPSNPNELKWLGHFTEAQFIAIEREAVGQRIVSAVQSTGAVSGVLAQTVASAMRAKCEAMRGLPHRQ
jgi:hypothetical protein